MKLGIWITGLLSSFLMGGLIGVVLTGAVYGEVRGVDEIPLGLFFGAPGGALAFACFRLWRQEIANNRGD